MSTQQQISDTQRARIAQALNETYALLNRELNYLPHLRDQDQIAFCLSHIEKLNAMLDEVQQ